METLPTFQAVIKAALVVVAQQRLVEMQIQAKRLPAPEALELTGNLLEHLTLEVVAVPDITDRLEGRKRAPLGDQAGAAPEVMTIL